MTISCQKKAFNTFAWFWLILFLEHVKAVILKCLEEWKYVVKENKMPKYIIKDVEISSDESNKKDSNEENSNERKF